MKYYLHSTSTEKIIRDYKNFTIISHKIAFKERVAAVTINKSRLYKADTETENYLVKKTKAHARCRP